MHVVKFGEFLESRGALAGDGLIRLPTASEGGLLAANGALIDYIREFIALALDQFGDEAAVVAFAVEAYRKYLKPIDLPGVPNLLVEPMVDEALERLIPAVIKVVWARLHGA